MNISTQNLWAIAIASIVHTATTMPMQPRPVFIKDKPVTNYDASLYQINRKAQFNPWNHPRPESIHYSENDLNHINPHVFTGNAYDTRGKWTVVYSQSTENGRTTIKTIQQ